MKRLVKVSAALLVGAVLAVVTGGPAHAVNVRYRAAKSCFINGREFRAEIMTYGKPTRAGQWTEVQQWGYVIEPAGGDTNNSAVQATLAKFEDGNWVGVSAIGWVSSAREDGYWHAGGFEAYPSPFIGYDAVAPWAVMVRVYLDGSVTKSCQVTLRPYDLYWIG